MWAVSRLGLSELISRHSRRWFMMAFAAQLAAAAPQEVSNVALAVGSMGWCSSSQWKQALLQAAAAKLDHFKPQELANLMYALPLLGAQPSQAWLSAFLAGWQDSCLKCAEAVLGKMNSQGISTLTWALARLQIQPSKQFVSLLLQRSQQHMAAASVTDLAMLVWGLGGLRCVAAYHSLRLLSRGRVADLVNLLVGVVRMRVRPDAQWVRAAEVEFLAAALPVLPRCTTRDFSFVIWGLAMLDVQPPVQWLDAYLVALRRQLPEMCSSDLSTVIWALAKLNHRPGKAWMQRFLDRVAAVTGDEGGRSRRQDVAGDGVLAEHPGTRDTSSCQHCKFAATDDALLEGYGNNNAEEEEEEEEEEEDV
eukprot:gene11779-11924_t